MDLLKQPVHSLKGIGPSKAKLLKKLGIETIEDLIYYFPRVYKDKSNVAKVKDLVLDEYATIKATVLKKPQEMKSKRGLLIIKFIVGDDTGNISAVWYNNRFIKSSLKQGDELFFYGRIKQIGTEKVIETPEFERVSEEDSINLLRIVPEYSLTEGLYQKDIRKAVYFALENIYDKMSDLFPEDFRRRFNLSEINFSTSNIHFPETMSHLELARRRFIFEEFFMLQSGFVHIKSMNEENIKGIVFEKTVEMQKIIESLPFKLTNAQLRVLDEVSHDMESSKVMNRLIQGDVGSGKTIVALLALYKCVRSGYQGMLMAPTEILAEQHLASFKQLLSDRGIRIGILKGGMSEKDKRETIRLTQEGEIDILIGTHALLEERVVFKKLGLIITDEQHRFGVRQRAVLFEKGCNPDMIVMTATPIPRTLTLILYCDLDISIIDEMPPGRKKIETYFIDSTKKERLFNFIKKELNTGRQAYIVCPLIEESEKLDLNSAVAYRQELQKNYFSDYKLDLLHGKMKASEKNEVMEAFRAGNTQILVSTTVIEVGVNIPNASIMIIENAERFGMAQLHQLRGRVGRGVYQSYCILISDSDNETSRERLKYMTKTENGFEIAEKDLELRGGGEMLGQRQHGLPAFKIADLFRDAEILKQSREAVASIYEQKLLDNPAYERMKSILDERFKKILEEITLN